VKTTKKKTIKKQKKNNLLPFFLNDDMICFLYFVSDKRITKYIYLILIVFLHYETLCGSLVRDIKDS